MISVATLAHMNRLTWANLLRNPFHLDKEFRIEVYQLFPDSIKYVCMDSQEPNTIDYRNALLIPLPVTIIADLILEYAAPSSGAILCAVIEDTSRIRPSEEKIDLNSIHYQTENVELALRPLLRQQN